MPRMRWEVAEPGVKKSPEARRLSSVCPTYAMTMEDFVPSRREYFGESTYAYGRDGCPRGRDARSAGIGERF